MQTCFSRLIIYRYIHFIVIGLLVFPVWSCQGQQFSDVPKQKNNGHSFGHLVKTLSGKGGYFDTDNLISNESSYLHVIPKLYDLNISGGAYLGVGPDQNFSYIAHIKPEIVFIVDIRRDNMLMHLLYKSIFELSENRLQFLSYLFARNTPSDSLSIDTVDVNTLMDVVERSEPMVKEREELQDKINQKLQEYDINLSEKDIATVHRFHNEFIQRGPGLRFTSHNRSPRAYYPTYKQLIIETDSDGNYASFLSQESHYKFLRDLHKRDRIIPLVGNFADSDALPAVGKYLKEINVNVSAFYTSNVEYYLMYQGQFPSFLENVKQLPLKKESVIIRSYFNRFRSSHPETISGYASTQLLQSIESMLTYPEATYSDLIFEYYIP